MINPSSLQQHNEEHIKELHRQASHYRLVANASKKQSYSIHIIVKKISTFFSRPIVKTMNRMKELKSRSISEMIFSAEDV